LYSRQPDVKRLPARCLPWFVSVSPGRCLRRIYFKSSQCLLITYTFATTHDISLPSGKIKLCQCIIKHCITKKHGRVDSQNVEDKAERRIGCESPVGDYRHSRTFSLTSALDRGEWSRPRRGLFTPEKVTQYPFYRRLFGPVWTCG
jgi:hypothetical protein